MNKNWKQRIAQEVIRVLVAFCVLMFICRLWPILLLGILGIFVAIIRLLFLSVPKQEEQVTLPILPAPSPEPTEEEVMNLAYALIQKRVSEKVYALYPTARWIWELPNARQKIQAGEDVFILLNQAGGYKKARVVIQNLQVVAIEFVTAEVTNEESSEDEPDIPDDTEEEEEQVKENFELIAYEWVQANILNINAKCNEAIGNQQEQYIIQADELPQEGSWENICEELENAGLEQVERIPEGIKIILKQ